MACFIFKEAICEDPDEDEEDEYNAMFDEIDGEEMATQLFINDEELIERTPTKTPWEVTEMLNKAEELTQSIEKVQISPTKTSSPAKKVRRQLNVDVLTDGNDVDGVYTYSELSTEHVQQIEETVENSVQLDLFDSEEVPEISTSTTELANEGQLRSNFFKWSTAETVDDFCNDQNKKGARWYDVARTMKSDKTMQKDWIIFCAKPLTNLRKGPYRCHIALEALLCNDADNIRCKSLGNFVMYLLEYKDKSRSVNGLRKLLAQVNVTTALFGAPFKRKPLVRDWIKKCTSALDSKKDLTWLQEVCGTASGFRFNPEEMIQFCEESEPVSVEILIANYRREGDNGNENAKAWIEMSSAYNNAQHCYKMWKATERGKTMQMTLPEYIQSRHNLMKEGVARHVTLLLAMQGVNEISFLNTVRKWLRGSPKSNILVFVGPGNSGKSMFAESLMIFLDGAILSICESNGFWKQGMISKRYCLIDDVTLPQWRYLDINERRALDGGLIAVNKKYSDAVECRMPPTVMTTNYDIRLNDDYTFLVNRLTWITFTKPLPLKRSGLGVLIVTPADIAAWFFQYKDTLDLE
ncbi:MAG: E1 protein [Melanogrammus aeglefinus-associated papillomavirus 2]|nr:MAG: E1 protein [Melanogrammus aeglefinus-associated papillomavirus 2]